MQSSQKYMIVHTMILHDMNIDFFNNSLFITTFSTLSSPFQKFFKGWLLNIYEKNSIFAGITERRLR